MSSNHPPQDCNGTSSTAAIAVATSLSAGFRHVAHGMLSPFLLRSELDRPGAGVEKRGSCFGQCFFLAWFWNLGWEHHLARFARAAAVQAALAAH